MIHLTSVVEEAVSVHKHHLEETTRQLEGIHTKNLTSAADLTESRSSSVQKHLLFLCHTFFKFSEVILMLRINHLFFLSIKVIYFVLTIDEFHNILHLSCLKLELVQTNNLVMKPKNLNQSG